MQLHNTSAWIQNLIEMSSELTPVFMYTVFPVEFNDVKFYYFRLPSSISQLCLQGLCGPSQVYLAFIHQKIMIIYNYLFGFCFSFPNSNNEQFKTKKNYKRETENLSDKVSSRHLYCHNLQVQCQLESEFLNS